MARPRNTLFYETPLPDFLPPEKEWLRDYHKNSRKVLEYIVRNGAKSTAYHGAIKALTLFREHLLQNGGSFSPADASLHSTWYWLLGWVTSCHHVCTAAAVKVLACIILRMAMLTEVSVNT